MSCDDECSQSMSKTNFDSKILAADGAFPLFVERLESDVVNGREGWAKGAGSDDPLFRSGG
jgi:hypothetical protein